MKIATLKRKVMEILKNQELDVVFKQIKGSLLGINEVEFITISTKSHKIKSTDGVPNSPAATLLHEIMHEVFPRASEKFCRKMTKEVWDGLTPHQKLALYEYLFERKQ
jgi:hypothetical protein